MRTLYQFPLSHFCEKARWLLDHKELDFVAQNLIPGVHRAFAQLKTGQNKLPILRDRDNWVADSTDIALYLDECYPEHRLLRSEPRLRAEALEINALANDLGVHVRRWVLAHSLSEHDQTLQIILGEKGYLRKFEKYTKPMMKTLMAKSYELEADKVAHSKSEMQRLIEILNQKLINQYGRYLVGDRLGFADIAVCSMLAPVLEVAGTPWEQDQERNSSEEFEAYKRDLIQLPLGQYVLRVYQTERNARIDWRGV